MAHQEQLQYMVGLERKFPDNFKDCRVLEVGSLFVNGTIRTLFKRCDYIGLDVGDGPFVDVVCRGEDYDAPSESFQTCVSCECFEHNPEWAETFKNMVRLCEPGGLVAFTCATTGRPEHGTMWAHPGASPLTCKESDYYKNLTEENFREVFDFDRHFSECEFRVNEQSKDLYFYGIKK